MLSKLISFAVLMVSVWGACPNSCSGHGRCTNYAMSFASTPSAAIAVGSGNWNPGSGQYGWSLTDVKKDSCTCFTRKGHDGGDVYAWSGADCSRRTCPHAPAFAGAALDNSASYTLSHAYVHTQKIECSGQGTCDTNTGQCQCFPGYTGEACHRTACPNDCSGVGQCLPLSQIAENVKDQVSDFFGNYMSSTQYDAAFDSSQSMGCVCDKGRFGPDCSLVECPSQADPMGGAGSESGRPCSGRGRCDYASGTCDCFKGFYGYACETQHSQTL